MDFSRLASCPHLGNQHASLGDINKLEYVKSCASCDYAGLNLWICLQRNCLRVGCSETVNDHSTEHFQRNKSHCVHLNLSSQRAWCYLCEREVVLGADQPIRLEDAFAAKQGTTSPKDLATPADEDGDGMTSSAMGGLMGLQNIANTCYMNSALQALSNVLPLTHYFLNCSDLVQHTLNQGAHRSKAGLAKNYQQLMRDIWCRKSNGKDYIAPRGVLHGIRIVYPMFRGFHQHDTQEFLRCFMDQLHEELKEPRLMLKQKDASSERPQQQQQQSEHFTQLDDDDASSASSSPSRSSSLSDTEYETCDSGTGSTQDSFGQESSSTFASSPLHTSAPSAGEQRKSRGSASAQLLSQSTVRSIISDIFDGKLLSSVQCLTCDRVSTREETFQDLSLPIPNRDHLNLLHQTHSLSAQSLNSIDAASARSVNDSWLSWLWSLVRSWLWGPSVTLHDCMASFFSADELKGDNMYSCEKCNKLRTGVKYSQILELPEVLCIHLKRFRHDLSYSSKISSHVHFPLDGFDLRPYLHKDCTSHVALYQLVSVICHHGTVGGGHYTCFARNALTNLWYEYDDQNVSEVSAEAVQNCQAYVLFYQKHNPQMELLRAEASELAAASRTAHPANNIRFYVAREWLSRFNTFAEPGPINNWAMLCPHGGLLQSKIALIDQIAVPISQALWDLLYRKFGGGPAINMLFECEQCRQAAEALARRQYYEQAVFTKYNGLDDGELDASAIYAISMPWLRKWQQFVRGLTHKEPGPISNANIVPTTAPNAADAASAAPIRHVRPGSDYAQLTAPLWLFLHGIYGGGPEIMLRGSLNEEIEIIDQDEYEGDSCNGTADLSDTESNIAQRNAAAVNEADRVGENEREPQQNSEPAAVVVESTAASDEHSASHTRSLTNHAPREGRHGKHYAGSSARRAKAVITLRSTLRKRTLKSRSALKNADLFGAKGNYSQHKGLDEREEHVQIQRLDAHSAEDVVFDGKRVAFNKLHSKRQQQPQLPDPQSFPTDHTQSSQFENANFTAVNSRDGEYSSSRSVRRRNKSSKRAKHVMKLQKFAQLQESSASTETDV